MSDTESKPVKGENDGEGSEHINLKVQGQVDARICCPPVPPRAASLPPPARPYCAPRREQG